MPFDPYISFAIVCLCVASCASLGARSLRGFSRHELELRCEKNRRLDWLGEILRMHERAAHAAECVWIVALLLAAAAVAWRFPFDAWSLAATWRLVPGALVGVVAALLVLIIVPAALAKLVAEPLLLHTWPLWRLGSWLLAPVALTQRVVEAMLAVVTGRPRQATSEETFEEEIRTIVTEGHREGLIEENAREMIESVIELGDVEVSQIMTPRIDMISAPRQLALSESLAQVIGSGHSRLPVYDKSRDDVVGVVHVKDVLAELAKPPEARAATLGDVARPAFFVPETKSVDTLLRDFQRTHSHMAVVLDEYGGVSGLVTIEDVLEEIVGEIADEHDEIESESIRRLDEHTSEVLGRLHIGEVNEQLGLNLPEDDDFDTLAGLVFSRLGHMPKPGEELIVDGLRIKVIEASRRRIDRLRIERPIDGQLPAK